MSYNCKIFDYGGLIQIRYYNKTIDTDVEEKKNETKENEVFYEQQVLQFDEDNKNDSVDNSHSFNSSQNRTKNLIYQYAYANKWEYFVTLTISPDVSFDRFDYKICKSKLLKWLNNLRRKAPDLKYLFVPELHKDGAIHFHGLVANVGNISFTDSGRVSVHGKAYKYKKQYEEFPKIYNLNNWKYGFSTATEVQNTYKCASYLCKYLTKDLIDVSKGMRRFFPSNNLDKGIVTECMMDSEQLNTLLTQWGDCLTYKKTVTLPELGRKINYYHITTE